MKLHKTPVEPLNQQETPSAKSIFTPARLMTLTAIVIFISEAVVMVILWAMPEVKGISEALVDSAILTSMMMPALYYLFYLPMMRHLDGKEKASAQLARIRESMENAEVTANFGVWEWDVSADTVFISKGAMNILGRGMKEIGGGFELYLSCVHPLDAHMVRKNFEELVDHGKSLDLEYRVLKPDLSERTIRHRAEVLSSGGVKVKKISGTIKDTTERAKVESEMEKLAMAVDQAAEAIVITDTSGAIQYVNPAFERITGYAKKEALGRNPRILKSGKHEDKFYRDLWKAISSGKVWRGNITNKKKNGEIYEDEAIISPLFDHSGRIVSYVAVKRDITKEMELEKKVRRSQKMEAIGALAGGIAHDFNNILSSIIGYTEMAMEEMKPGSGSRDDLLEVLKAGKRARDLVSQILIFSRKGEQDKRPLNPHLLVKESIKLFRASMPSSIEVISNIDSTCGVVTADPSQLNQVIMNLLSNAAHAMKGMGGILSVSLQKAEIGPGVVQNDEPIKEGSYVLLTVGDTGRGIKKEDMDRIFEPFFTTKSVGEGTGLGLAIVHGIVTGMDGAITVSSAPDKGAVFSVYLPRFGESTEAKEETYSGAPKLKGGAEHILVIDDEEMVAKFVARALSRAGYKVTMKTNPLEALEFMKANIGGFDLIITDHAMPDLTGDLLLQQAREAGVGAPAIILTGVATNIAPERASFLKVSEVVSKPVLVRELADVVRSVLDRAGAGKPPAA